MSGLNGLREFTKRWVVTIVMIPSLAREFKKIDESQKYSEN